jgi:hypothetical protein
VADLLESYLESGGRIGVRPPCAKTHGVTDENRVPKSEWMGAAAVLAAGSSCRAASDTRRHYCCLRGSSAGFR